MIKNPKKAINIPTERSLGTWQYAKIATPQNIIPISAAIKNAFFAFIGSTRSDGLRH